MSSIYFRHRAHGFSNILLASDFNVNWDSRNTRFPYTALVIEKNTPKRILYKYFEIVAWNADFARTPTFGVEQKIPLALRGIFICIYYIEIIKNLATNNNPIIVTTISFFL